MSIRGTFLKNTTRYVSKITDNSTGEGVKNQSKQLKKLLSKAKNTEFGKRFGFAEILKAKDMHTAFKASIPIYDYELMFQHFWHKTLSGVSNVSWPGKIDQFALTSGTTGAASKRIPVSDKMIQTIHKTSIKKMLSLSKLDLPPEFYEKDILFLGGSTQLEKINDHFEGDLSGIITSKIPNWIAPFSKPEKEIRALRNWEKKITEMVKKAPSWDVGIVCGVPAWMQILIERIVDCYGLDSIHQIWPNLRIYVHGGVSFEPYMTSFNALFSSQVIYLETYLCSEGLFAYQSVNSNGLELLTKANVYYEFIPFDAEHFNSDGELINDDSLCLEEVEEGVDYALIVTTCSGAWRYLLGDTISFTNLAKNYIKITGRTKHFLNLCGEHLSVDNMTDALTRVTYKNKVEVREFAVIGNSSRSGNFKHTWYLGCDKPPSKLNLFKHDLDYTLSTLNADYLIERNFALEEIEVIIVSPKAFYDFMKIKNRYGAQHKFPRVLKGDLAKDWVNYLNYVLND